MTEATSLDTNKILHEIYSSLHRYFQPQIEQNFIRKVLFVSLFVYFEIKPLLGGLKPF